MCLLQPVEGLAQPIDSGFDGKGQQRSDPGTKRGRDCLIIANKLAGTIGADLHKLRCRFCIRRRVRTYQGPAREMIHALRLNAQNTWRR